VSAAIVVLAKEPVPGQVKTRLCPPCTDEQAAALAGAALLDTLASVRSSGALHRVVALGAGPGGLPAVDVLALRAEWGLVLVPQREGGLGARIAGAFADAATALSASMPMLLVGMDTPQASPALLDRCLAALGRRGVDAALGLADDGGWWALGLRDPARAELVAPVPMSTSDTGRLTLTALRAAGLRVAALPVLRDVDRWADALAVSAAAPGTRFAAGVSRVAAGLAGLPA
jgi:glycosyltransferase A (GT-A) superfamily protein (DUF2064 family)